MASHFPTLFQLLALSSPPKCSHPSVHRHRLDSSPGHHTPVSVKLERRQRWDKYKVLKVLMGVQEK